MKYSNRREFLKLSLFTGIGLSIPNSPNLKANHFNEVDYDFSFVHLTDMHVKRKRKGDIGYKTCINHVNQLKPAPDMVLMGGDGTFDGMYTQKEEYLDQLDLFKSISDQLKVPYYPCIGNHDTFGLSSRRKTTSDDPDIGKELFKGKLGLENTYYSFNHKSWHFVIMDSMLEKDSDHGPVQDHEFGETQLNWLRKDLGQHSKSPTIIVTHVAAFCNIGQYNSDTELKAMNHMVVKDNLAFREIIERHNVKAVLQGHSHIPEDYLFNDIWYITSQSVSAAWWGGNWKGYEPGYTLFKVKNEQLLWQRINFDWAHQLEPEDTLEKQKIEERAAFIEEQKRLKSEDLLY
jgi:3',5'-cyclic AMP phosphodiesterase CpdA